MTDKLNSKLLKEKIVEFVLQNKNLVSNQFSPALTEQDLEQF